MVFQIPNTFESGTKAVADEVNTNFTVIEDEINSIEQELNTLTETVFIKADGSVDFVAPQKYSSIVTTETLNLDSMLASVGKVKEIAQNFIDSIPIQKQPFSVNSGAVDEYGNADFIQKDSNTQVTILAATIPLVMTYPNGAQETITEDVVISGISACAGTVQSITRSSNTATVTISSAHGLSTGAVVTISGCNQVDYNITATITRINDTQFSYTVANSPTTPAIGSPAYSITYEFVKEYGVATPIAILSPNAITESRLSPSDGIDDDYLFQYGIEPGKGWKKISDTWTETQFVRLGRVVKTSGTLGTPISYAFNGKYISEWFAVTTNAIYVVNHNIGNVPEEFSIFYKNSSQSEDYRQPVFLNGGEFIDNRFWSTGAERIATAMTVKIWTGKITNSSGNPEVAGVGSGEPDDGELGNMTSGYYQVIAKRGF